MTAKEAFFHALNVIKGRWPEGEEVISQDAGYSYYYAFHVLKDRFPEGEEKISRSTYYSFLYAREIIKGKLPDWWHNKMVLLSAEDKWAKRYCLEFLK